MDSISVLILNYLISKTIDIGIGTLIREKPKVLVNNLIETIQRKFGNGPIPRENKDLQRAIRISFLNATLVAIDHYQKNNPKNIPLFSKQKDRIAPAIK
ncbi:MAG: hypothetical protein WD426_00375 [Anditalea sp.]